MSVLNILAIGTSKPYNAFKSRCNYLLTFISSMKKEIIYIFAEVFFLLEFEYYVKLL